MPIKSMKGSIPVGPAWVTDGREMRQEPREVADSTILVRG